MALKEKRIYFKRRRFINDARVKKLFLLSDLSNWTEKKKKRKEQVEE